MIDIDPHLERQYNNRAAVPDHPDYLESWAERSLLYRQQVDACLNQSYGDSKRQVMDIFPSNLASSPVHVFIHGGYWQALSKDSFSFMAQAFNEQGECAVILNYDLCPQVTLAEIIQQIRQAMAWILLNIKRYGGDPERLQVTGHSAGAHLLAELLTTDWSTMGLPTQTIESLPLLRLNGLSGIYDLRPLIHTSVNHALGLDQERADLASPIRGKLWEPLPSMQLNLVVGELESDEYKLQSQHLQKAWQQQVTISYQETPDAHHFSILDHFLERYYQAL